ncbi:hypothetical protein CAOG_08979, partial [Capsaspora owczarzaki ATCC 30864]|uniref:hypothetical protein n=1 Tax=Capsaspora owczarzaki (strain ATCC 30864) TaxID=595528 RepID=UPI000352443C
FLFSLCLLLHCAFASCRSSTTTSLAFTMLSSCSLLSDRVCRVASSLGSTCLFFFSTSSSFHIPFSSLSPSLSFPLSQRSSFVFFFFFCGFCCSDCSIEQYCSTCCAVATCLSISFFFLVVFSFFFSFNALFQIASSIISQHKALFLKSLNSTCKNSLFIFFFVILFCSFF